MTDEERRDEGAEEAVEDLEAPAEEQDDVAGGQCHKPTQIKGCDPKVKSCAETKLYCQDPKTNDIVMQYA